MAESVQFVPAALLTSSSVKKPKRSPVTCLVVNSFLGNVPMLTLVCS